MPIIETVAILNMISLGLDVASKAFEVAKKVDEGQEQAKVEMGKLQDLVIFSTESLQKTIRESSGQIIDKIERDKMEELVARIRNIDTLIRMGKRDTLFSYVFQLQESVHYAENRLGESKHQWLLPYIAGKSMVVATFAYLGKDDREAYEELHRVREESKRKILNEVTAALLQAGKPIPWDLVEGIFENELNAVEEFVALLPEKIFDLTGEWVLKQQDSSGGINASVYLVQRVNHIYGQMIIPTKSGIVQQFVEGSIDGKDIKLTGVWVKVAKGQYNLDRWSGVIQDDRTISGTATDTSGAIGTFMLTRNKGKR